MTPEQYCQQKAAQSGSSFYYSFLFLPPQRRQAITALYAFCREVDDVVDESSDPQVARTSLGWWRSEIARMAQNEPSHPVTRALQPHVKTFDLPIDQLLAVIDGMEMDLSQTRYLDFKGLEHYCWHVASVVGLLSARIFGITDERTLQYAEKLGLAFQLTNIIRDVGEDARRDRIYLPISELQQFEVPASEILNAKHSDRFERLMRFQAERAQRYYDEAFRATTATRPTRATRWSDYGRDLSHATR
jgi:15-cis-phytoene synthase